MKCKVEGCDSECKHYPGKGVCQKHYFRMMRYGTYELTKRGKRKDRTKNSKGYQMINCPDHPLVMANGFVYEHRKVIYDRYGDTLPPCQICGKEVTWKTAHIDHITEEVWNMISRGKVRKGMTTDECRLALGNPIRIHIVTGGHETWSYERKTLDFTNKKLDRIN